MMARGVSESYKPALPTHLSCWQPAPPRARAAHSAAATPPATPPHLFQPRSDLEPEALRRLFHGAQSRFLPPSSPDCRGPRCPATGPAQGQGRRHEAAGQGGPGDAGQPGPRFFQHHDLPPPTATTEKESALADSAAKPGLDQPRIQRPPAPEGRQGL